MGKYTRPDDLPGRVCRVLEAMAIVKLECKGSVWDVVYRFAHLASGRCHCAHEGWMAEFLATELEMEEAVFTEARLTE